MPASAFGFTKFDPRAFLENAPREGAAAKAANPAKVSEAEPEPTFATFATFAQGPAQNENCHSMSEPWTDVHDERAAIAEHDGGAPRDWAEGLSRLDPARLPADVSPRRWRQFIEDAGRFLDGGWAARAPALGWRALDIFGCDRERPFVRLDRAGLIWLINGGKLIAMTADSATIERQSGARQTYRRVSAEPSCIALAWELD
jgi:hypothetical protein